ncbi:MAG TPA: transposase [Bacteroidales bacterium]|nr:transposase [Bacteroidales bacterium]
MKEKEIRLEPGKFYHVYNRGNNRENLFYNNGNYEYFLRKYDNYLTDYIDTFAFCLLPNHFHLLVRIKDKDLSGFKNLTGLEKRISKQFSNLFNSYAKSINIQQKRVGSLFQRPFKRIEITTTDYLANLVFYIHANPQKHKIIDDFRMYPWSSYDRILKNKPSKLNKEEVLEWFSNKDYFIKYHEQKADIEKIKNMILEA